MIVKFSGAILGLLAFSVAVVGGLWVGNPATVVLSRAIWSLVVFCALGLVVGFAAHAVVEEYAHRRFDAVRAEVQDPDESGEPADENATTSTSQEEQAQETK